MELHEFHEHRFGSVPLAEIDYAWFTRLAGSHYKPLTRALKRGVDLLIAVPAAFSSHQSWASSHWRSSETEGPRSFAKSGLARAGRLF